ncbi:YqaJ-like viral recombinase domain [Musa troglodytarum]|uniref:YqaJ-like viral recombinase domain n=1 Tax=Musa troglodytarum TaxID=320322 RepID=A0A9E7HZJ7_9LILI|nr:YqaJ-like viral recombinase domain [Musa troglodytarum]
MRAILPHRVDLSSPFPSTDALHLFVRAALRKQVAFASPRAAAAARGGAGRRTRHTDSPWRPPAVFGFLRTLQPSLIANFDRPVTSIMSCSCVGHAKFLPSKRNREEWFALRRDKLTTSTFSTALGFWKGNRRSELWYQKVFAPEADMIEAPARAAMDWGVFNEPAAIERYKSITGRDVSSLGFAIHAEASCIWLGASPDGLLGCYPDGGILEVKCPYNKGKPELALPWQIVPYYYMPQVQGQMEIMNRDWVDLYCWTPNGSSIFRVYRDRAYWDLMHRILHEFWWGSVVPAREALLMGREADARAYEPKRKHQLTGLVIGTSRKLAADARLLCRDIGGHIEFFR